MEEGRRGSAGQVLNQEAGEGLAKGRLEQRLISRRDQLNSHLEKRNWEIEQPEERLRVEFLQAWFKCLQGHQGHQGGVGDTATLIAGC